MAASTAAGGVPKRAWKLRKYKLSYLLDVSTRTNVTTMYVVMAPFPNYIVYSSHLAQTRMHMYCMFSNFPDEGFLSWKALPRPTIVTIVLICESFVFAQTLIHLIHRVQIGRAF